MYVIKKLLVLLSFLVGSIDGRGINGGFSCAACTILFGMAQQLAEIHNETLLAASLKICDILPSSTSVFCKKAIHKLEPILVDPDVMMLFTPDIFCYAIKSCYVEPGGTKCHLFPEPKLATFDQSVDIIQAAGRRHGLWSPKAVDFCSLPWIRELCWLLSKGWTRMEPAVDIDGDLFSLFTSARGSNWRGRDCRDFDKLSYPGRRSEDANADTNCNGIFGRDPNDGSLYESALCGDDGRGLVYIGDSVGAHFHFPEAWMNPKLIAEEVLHNYTQHLLDELDWPQLGFATGFVNTSEPLLIQGITDSVYLRLRARNRCNHRDYQNLSRNGASSFDLVDYVRNVARNKTRDKPALALYASFGNDVCNPYKDTLSYMTTPERFRKNVLSVLRYLDDALPDGSHVILIGLVDGGRIYPTMAERLHPLGELHQNVRYRDVYDWFTCMEIGPCAGWMTGNSTLRKITTSRARKLSDMLYDISITESFSSFKIGYLRNPMEKAFNSWASQGKPVWKLIDPIDSLHPSQLAQPLVAEALWNDLLEKYPEALGKENPFNAKIEELFGDQGGH